VLYDADTVTITDFNTHYRKYFFLITEEKVIIFARNTESDIPKREAFCSLRVNHTRVTDFV
jgi:hypothetical protein